MDFSIHFLYSEFKYGFVKTDMYHHLDFLSQGENYRRVFIKALNEKYTETKMADANFFKSVKDFNYKFPLLFHCYTNIF